MFVGSVVAVAATLPLEADSAALGTASLSSIGRLFSNHYDANEAGSRRESSAGLGKGRRRGSTVGSRRSRKVIKYSKTSQLK